MQLIRKYFPDLSIRQMEQYEALESLYSDWNEKINVISRKDIDQLYLRHVLHSLSIACFIRFKPGSEILDVGTGGGFPGIPLAIFYPDVRFTLVDSIGKKIKLVQAVAGALSLENVSAIHGRAEKTRGEFDFVVSRAVTSLPVFIPWVRTRIRKHSRHAIKNGILALKGGDLSSELNIPYTSHRQPVSQYFSEEYFATKQIVHVALSRK